MICAGSRRDAKAGCVGTQPLSESSGELWCELSRERVILKAQQNIR